MTSIRCAAAFGCMIKRLQHFGSSLQQHSRLRPSEALFELLQNLRLWRGVNGTARLYHGHTASLTGAY